MNGDETPCMDVFTNLTDGSEPRFLMWFVSNLSSTLCSRTRAYSVCNPEMYSKYACVNSSVLSAQSLDSRSVSGSHNLLSGFRFSKILSAIPESCGSII